MNSADTGITLADRSTGRQTGWSSQKSLNHQHIFYIRSEVLLRERCRPSGSVCDTTSEGGFLHSSERSSTPTQIKTRSSSSIKRRIVYSLNKRKKNCRTVTQPLAHLNPCLINLPGKCHHHLSARYTIFL